MSNKNKAVKEEVKQHITCDEPCIYCHKVEEILEKGGEHIFGSCYDSDCNLIFSREI